jgi:hypothetical protein
MTWLDDRTPPMPNVFRRHLHHHMGEAGSPEGLTEAARAEMTAALARTAENREAAFHLLAADAYASYACEAAAGAEMVEPALIRILDSLQSTEAW